MWLEVENRRSDIVQACCCLLLSWSRVVSSHTNRFPSQEWSVMVFQPLSSQPFYPDTLVRVNS